MEKLTWKVVPAYFVSFNCPECKGQIDQGFLEVLGIANGDNYKGIIDCPYFNCQHKFKIEITREST